MDGVALFVWGVEVRACLEQGWDSSRRPDDSLTWTRVKKVLGFAHHFFRPRRCVLSRSLVAGVHGRRERGKAHTGGRVTRISTETTRELSNTHQAGRRRNYARRTSHMPLNPRFQLVRIPGINLLHVVQGHLEACALSDELLAGNTQKPRGSGS